MAKLTDEIVTTIFALERQLFERIDQATATEFEIFERFGETEETLNELEELTNIKERLREPYSRLTALLLIVAEYQPTAPSATLDLLSQTIYRGQAISDAARASIEEIKRSWNL
jgi:hypothetical protein